MKRRLKGFMLLVMAAVILAGCSNTPASVSPGSESPEASQADAGAKHLNVAYHSEIKSLDPGKTSWETTRIGVGERLFKINDHLELEPWLVQTYQRLDELTWEFILRDDVNFSNGKKMTGESVKACLERTIAMNPRAVTMLNIVSIEVNGQKLTVKTNGINAALPNNMADVVCTILDTDTLSNETGIPVGTGPFVIQSMTEGRMELTANQDYWNGTPKLGSITIKYITDGNAQAMALDNGEVDLTFQLPTENVMQFMGNDRFAVTKSSGSRSQIIYFDYENQFLSDLNVRKAITMAIDRGTFADVINKGNSEAATAIFPVSFSYGNVKGVGYDREGAKKLLADSGYTDSDGDGILDKNGVPMSFKLYSYGSHGSLLPTFCEAIQASLKEIGIGIDIQINDYEPHTNFLKNGGFDLALNSYIMAPVADPQYFADIMLKSGADYNYGKYSNPEVDALIAQLDEEFDAGKRQELAKEIQKKIVEDCGFLTIGHLKYQIAANKKVTGYSTQATEYYLLNETTDINA